MSEELAIVKDDTNEGGAGAVAAFVVGGIVATAVVGSIAGITRVRVWNRDRREERLLKKLAKVQAVKTEETVPAPAAKAEKKK